MLTLHDFSVIPDPCCADVTSGPRKAARAANRKALRVDMEHRQHRHTHLRRHHEADLPL